MRNAEKTNPMPLNFVAIIVRVKVQGQRLSFAAAKCHCCCWTLVAARMSARHSTLPSGLRLSDSSMGKCVMKVEDMRLLALTAATWAQILSGQVTPTMHLYSSRPETMK